MVRRTADELWFDHAYIYLTLTQFLTFSQISRAIGYSCSPFCPNFINNWINVISLGERKEKRVDFEHKWPLCHCLCPSRVQDVQHTGSRLGWRHHMGFVHQTPPPGGQGSHHELPSPCGHDKVHSKKLEAVYEVLVGTAGEISQKKTRRFFFWPPLYKRNIDKLARHSLICSYILSERQDLILHM